MRNLPLKPAESAAIADPKATPVIVMPALSRHPLQLANVIPGLRPADSGRGLIMDSGRAAQAFAGMTGSDRRSPSEN